MNPTPATVRQPVKVFQYRLIGSSDRDLCPVCEVRARNKTEARKSIRRDYQREQGPFAEKFETLRIEWVTEA